MKSLGFIAIQWTERHVRDPEVVVPVIVAIGFVAFLALRARATRQRSRPRA